MRSIKNPVQLEDPMFTEVAGIEGVRRVMIEDFSDKLGVIFKPAKAFDCGKRGELFTVWVDRSGIRVRREGSRNVYFLVQNAQGVLEWEAGALPGGYISSAQLHKEHVLRFPRVSRKSKSRKK